MKFISKEGAHTIINFGFCKIKLNLKYRTNKIYLQTITGELKEVKRPPKNVKIRFRGENACVIFSEVNIKKSFENTFFELNSNCKVNIGSVHHYRAKNLFVYMNSNSELEIGDNFNCAGCSFFIGTNSKIKIGKDCMFSNTIIVRTSDSHAIIDTETHKRINPAKNVIIGDHVWIAPSTTIMKGANIGSNTIVGSHTLVTKSIPSNVLAVGMPAKVVKEGVTWSREDVIFKKKELHDE